MAKYSLKFKLKVVIAYINGEGGYDTLAKKYGVPSSKDIRQWVKMYKQYGEDGLKRARKNRSYSIEFKLDATALYESSEMSYAEVAIHFGLNNPSLIPNWRRQFREEGIGGLSKRKGRPPMVNKDELSMPKTQDTKLSLDEANKRIQELEYELHLATIKNEYLEQLRSLGHQKAMKTKQESSTNSEKNTD